MYEEIKAELYEVHSLSKLSDEELYRLINSIYLKQNADKNIPIDERIKAVDRIYSSIRGFGVLDELLLDDGISEIMINGYDNIFVEKNGALQRSIVGFDDEKNLFDIIQRIVGQSGREVNTANPIVDTHLPGGERVNVVLPPVAIGSPIVTIRRFPKQRIRMEDLIAFGSITEQAACFLEELVRNRYNIFISGGTSSGKTTFLNVLSDYIPKNERIITIEDSAELQIKGIENLIRLEARNSNTAGSGEITIRDLIKTSLRMRPDRIIVGEVRGSEAIDMLGAMNTGHDGSLSTGHANGSYDMLCRLETMVMQAEMSFPLLAVRQYIASSIDIIVHLCKTANKTRRVAEICEVTGVEDGQIGLNRLFEFSDGTLKRTNKKLINKGKLSFYTKATKDEKQETH